MRTSLIATILGLTFALGGCGGPAPLAERDPTPGWVTPGTKLMYWVDFRGKRYNFAVRLGELAPDVRFEWVMGDPVNSKGERTILAADLATSEKQNNRFQPDESGPIAGQTSVWLSRRNYAELRTVGKTMLSVDGAAPIEVVSKGEVMYPLSIGKRGTEVPALHVEAADGRAWWILRSAEHPIILRQQIGFEVKLSVIFPY